MVLGEAVKRLSEDFRSAHPEVLWRQIAGMRDALIHQYDGVDMEEVWRTIDFRVPELMDTLERLIPEQDRP